MVPVTALIDDGEATYIAVVEEQKVRRIPVTLGVDGDVNVEVIPADGYRVHGRDAGHPQSRTHDG